MDVILKIYDVQEINALTSVVNLSHAPLVETTSSHADTSFTSMDYCCHCLWNNDVYVAGITWVVEA